MKIWILVAILFSSSVSSASELRTVLITSAYGAGAGALAGVTALAFSDKPDQNLNFVTRGASLGLYVGLAVGIYLASQPEAGAQALLLPTQEGDVVPGFGYAINF